MHEIKHREKSPIVCPALLLCIGVLTWIHICSHVTSHVIIAKHKHTNRKGELRKKNNTNNKIINIKPYPIYLSQFFQFIDFFITLHPNLITYMRKIHSQPWSLGIIMFPRTYSLVVQLYGPPRPQSNSTNLPARSPTCVNTYYEPPRSQQPQV